MTLPKWDDEMKFELLRLKSELKPENFRALHQAIGLGLIKQEVAEDLASSLLPPVSASIKSQIEKSPSHSLAASPLENIPNLPPLPEMKEISFGQKLIRFAFAHLLDIGFVCLTLGLGILFASWLIDPAHVSGDFELMKQATPLRFILEAQALALVLGLYAFFLLYWLFFKLVSGLTLGESFLENFWILQNFGRAAPTKDSRDS